MNRGEILKTAESLVNGDRAKQHGDFRKNYESTATLWNAYFEGQGISCPSFSVEDVLMMMALMKVARMFQNDNTDNYVDACGYIALAGEIATDGGNTDAS